MVTIKTKPAIVEGIIAVANHKLRVEGIKSYKKYLSKKFYSEKDIKDLVEEQKKEVKEIFSSLYQYIERRFIRLDANKTRIFEPEYIEFDRLLKRLENKLEKVFTDNIYYKN